MFGTASPHHLVDDRPGRYGQPFLASHRAVAACTRELARLADAVVGAVAGLHGPMADEKPTVRRSPDRCIVQLGPVALTVAWLRGNHGSIADGELLVIVWRGAVAPRNERKPERPVVGPAHLGATPLWEQVLSAAGDSEDAWEWRPNEEAESERCSSTALAARCVGRLQAAYLESVVPPASLDLDAVRIT